MKTWLWQFIKTMGDRLWPDRIISKVGSRYLRVEHNALVNTCVDLLEALEFIVNAAETEPSMAIYTAHIQKAKHVIKKARTTCN